MPRLLPEQSQGNSSAAGASPTWHPTNELQTSVPLPHVLKLTVVHARIVLVPVPFYLAENVIQYVVVVPEPPQPLATRLSTGRY